MALVQRRRGQMAPTLPAAQVAAYLGKTLGGIIRSQVNNYVQQAGARRLAGAATQSSQVGTPTRRNRGARNRRQRQARASVPAAFGQRVRGGSPTFSTEDGRVILRHSEWFKDVQGSNSFSFAKYSITPENVNWLSYVAQCFSRYRFRRVGVQYQSTVGTTMDGLFAMGAMYDSHDTTPTTISQITGSAHNTRMNVWDSSRGYCNCEFDASRWNQNWYNYVGGTADLDDEHIPAWVVLGVSGAKNQQVGSLWIYYEIELLDPILPANNNPTLARTDQALRNTPQEVDEDPPQPIEEFTSRVTDLLEHIALRSAVEDASRTAPPPASTPPALE